MNYSVLEFDRRHEQVDDFATRLLLFLRDCGRISSFKVSEHANTQRVLAEVLHSPEEPAANGLSVFYSRSLSEATDGVREVLRIAAGDDVVAAGTLTFGGTPRAFGFVVTERTNAKAPRKNQIPNAESDAGAESET